MTKLQKAKRDVELQLVKKSASIDGSLTRLKSEVMVPGGQIGRFLREHPNQSLLGLIAVGAVVATLVIGRSKDKAPVSSERSTGVADAYADVLAKSVKEAESRGLSPDQALHAAVRTNPPVVAPLRQPAYKGYLNQFASRLIGAATTAALDYATKWLNELVRGRNEST